MTETNKLSKNFKLIAIIAIIWNILGVASYLLHAYMTPETIATLPQYQQDFMNNTPAWRTAAFAIATFSGLIASILLVMKKKRLLKKLLISTIIIFPLLLKIKIIILIGKQMIYSH